MDKIVTVSEMRRIEREADSTGLSYAQMMLNAGTNLAKIIESIYTPDHSKSILGIIGSGNNGGDTLVALNYLLEQGWSCSAYLLRIRDESDRLISEFEEMGGKKYYAYEETNYQVLDQFLSENAYLMDGVLGTGFHLPLSQELSAVLGKVKRYKTENPASIYTIAVDCPSGVDCDDGFAASAVIPADITITMAAVKRGLLSFPAADLTGELKVVAIGDLSKNIEWNNVNCWLVDAGDIAKVIPLRPRYAHKGTFGTALIIAGSINYPGAAILAGESAYRIGVGLVQMAVPQCLYTTLVSNLPEAIWLPLPDDEGYISIEAVDVIKSNTIKISAILLGPGFGMHTVTKDFLSNFLSLVLGNFDTPRMVVDADGLKLIKEIPDWYKRLPTGSILTPHPGEMSVLSGLSVDEIQADRIGTARKFSQKWGHVIVLKGAFTVIASPDGEVSVIPFATPALSRAGSGDILAGMIVGLIAQGVSSYNAAVAAAWIHARAGYLAGEELGSAYVLPRDMIQKIKDVYKQLS